VRTAVLTEKEFGQSSPRTRKNGAGAFSFSGVDVVEVVMAVATSELDRQPPVASDGRSKPSGAEVPRSMKSGAQIIWEVLVQEGVEVVFGYPGGAIMPTYDALPGYPIRHVLVRHEQGASHMADGYARASGKVGVAIATSGPGATNLVTGIATAMLDSTPVVFITGQVSSPLIGSDAFQEVDITGITLPITKHNYLVTRTSDIAPSLREAFFIARSGRPGPVLVDITKDAQQGIIDYAADHSPVGLPGYRPAHRVAA
jgi:acetolactate synthase-1/2/3 large subunit